MVPCGLFPSQNCNSKFNQSDMRFSRWEVVPQINIRQPVGIEEKLTMIAWQCVSLQTMNYKRCCTALFRMIALERLVSPNTGLLSRDYFQTIGFCDWCRTSTYLDQPKTFRMSDIEKNRFHSTDLIDHCRNSNEKFGKKRKSIEFVSLSAKLNKKKGVMNYDKTYRALHRN